MWRFRVRHFARGGVKRKIFAMNLLWQEADSDKDLKGGTAVWSPRGLLRVALCCAGWLLLVPLVQTSLFRGSYLGLAILLVLVLIAAGVSIAVVLTACVRRSWGVALVSLALTAAAVVVVGRQYSEFDYIGDRYRAHSAALADLAEGYRAGRLRGEVDLPPEVRSLSPSGFAYAGDTTLFVQMWQDWRAESGTGLAYFAEPPTPQTVIQTADGDSGRPQREVGGGWWWVA